jgi:hypothetical protein
MKTLERRKLLAIGFVIALLRASEAIAQHSSHPPTRATPDNQGLGKTGAIGEEGTGNLPHAGQADQSKSNLGHGETPLQNQDPGHQHTQPLQPMGGKDPQQKQ